MKTSPVPAAHTVPVAPASTRITAEEERDLIRRAQAGDRKAADAMVRAHLPYVRQAAGRYVRRMMYRATKITLDEAVSACFEGFAQALRRFDLAHGVRFLTYASWWLTHHMQRDTEAANIFGHAPSGSEERAISAIAEIGSTDPTALAEASGVKVTTAQNAVVVYRARSVSLDSPVRGLYAGAGDEEVTLYGILPADQPLADELLEAAEESRDLAAVVEGSLASLAPRVRQVVRDVIMADEPVSLAEVARVQGVSRERTRQMARDAKIRLRTAIQRRMAERAEGRSEGRVAA